MSLRTLLNRLLGREPDPRHDELIERADRYLEHEQIQRLLERSSKAQMRASFARTERRLSRR